MVAAHVLAVRHVLRERLWADPQCACGPNHVGFRHDDLRLRPAASVLGWRAAIEYQLFAAPKIGQRGNVRDRKKSVPSDFQRRFALGPFGTRVQYKWTRNIPFFARALVTTGEKIFAAGPPEVQDETEVDIGKLMKDATLTEQRLHDYLAAWEGEKGGRLWVISKEDGRVMQKYDFDFLPAFDSVAAAGGRLFVFTRDGRLVALSGAQ